MSDYVHKKVVRLPFPDSIMEKCNAEDAYECEDYLKEILGDDFNNRNKNGFEIETTDKSTYIDWVYYYTYGESSGDFGFSRLLTENELSTIKPYFDKLNIDYKSDDLRVVEYSYYNCCECADYYDLKSFDDSKLFIN